VRVPPPLFRLLLGPRLAKVEGSIAVPAIRAPVTIRRDRHGVPYIEAQSDDDAWYALGFCQGQDRAFQLETLLRVGRGTLAELAGKDLVGMDRVARRIGFRRVGEEQFPLLDGDVRRQIEAYTRGVNDGAKLGVDRKAHEFTLLMGDFTPWEPPDVVAMLAFLAFALASNWDIELARLRILRGDGPDAVACLDPAYPESAPVCLPPGAEAGPAVDRLAQDLASYQRWMGRGGASNAWVVAPSRTRTGRPILANDPHLMPSLPVSWYLAHIRTPEWAVSGASFVSQPAFSAGHNGFAAWGVTAGHHDNTDLFLEEMGPDGKSVRDGGRFVPCEVRREVIRVRGGRDVVEDVILTPRGPIVGPAFPGEIGAVSLKATWTAKKPTRGFYAFNRVKSFEEFRDLYRTAPCMSTSYVYADAGGSIGWTLVGDVPRRKKGNGTLPLPGWEAETGWEDDPVPFEQMPHGKDPEAGFFATSNNQPLQNDKEPFLGVDWLDGYRQARIVESLSARRDWDVYTTELLQMDPTSIPWREVRDILLALPRSSPDARLGLSLLRGFDGVVSVDSAGAAVFELFLAEMIRRIAFAKAPNTARWALGEGANLVLPHSLLALRRVSHLVRLMREQPAGWFSRSWPLEMADALEHTVRHLREKRGPSPMAWGWGHVRPVTLKHFAGEIGPLGEIFNRGPMPLGGDSATIPQASIDWLDPTANPVGVASMRIVMDVGNWEATRVVIAGGQSGNPMSPHYDDMLDLWRRGGGVALCFSAEAVARAAVKTLRLEPARK
jgi:penicillin G amidase